MSDFDLRKFLAEQKAPKEENIQEVEVNEEELDELRPGYAVGEMSPENNALLKALETLGSKAGAAGKKIAAWAKDNIELGKMSDAMKEEEMEETYHEGEEIEEGDMDESVVAGVAALIGGSIAAGKVLDYIADKYPEAMKKFVKAAGAAQRGSGKTGSGGSYITQEGEEYNEEEIKENAFKSSIKDILNS